VLLLAESSITILTRPSASWKRLRNRSVVVQNGQVYDPHLLRELSDVSCIARHPCDSSPAKALDMEPHWSALRMLQLVVGTESFVCEDVTALVVVLWVDEKMGR
jgi:hypothetical protein